MKKSLLNQLASLKIIPRTYLAQLEPNPITLNMNIARWTAQGLLIPLKKGFYIYSKTWEQESNKEIYLRFLANKLYEPSYVSGEYVMSQHGLLTEATYGITSFTTKKTLRFNNAFGRFSYYSIKPSLYLGYTLQTFPGLPILIATKAKAIFDFLYVRFRKQAPVFDQVAEELRINWDEVNRAEFQELQDYTREFGYPRFKYLIQLIEEKYYA